MFGENVLATCVTERRPLRAFQTVSRSPENLFSHKMPPQRSRAWWSAAAALLGVATGISVPTTISSAPVVGAPVAWQVGVAGTAPLPKPFGRESVIAAVESLKRGEVICVTDDENRENEGDLIMAGELATPHTVGFIVRYSTGVICCSVPSARLEELQLPTMYVNNQDPKGTAFTVSTDVRAYGAHRCTTGISAADRAATFNALADPSVGAEAFCRPGHVFPLRSKPGGCRERDGHTEAALDFCALAGCKPAGVLAEVCNEDGSMARIPQLIPFCEAHRIVLTSISDLKQYLDEVGHVSKF